MVQWIKQSLIYNLQISYALVQPSSVLSASVVGGRSVLILWNLLPNSKACEANQQSGQSFQSSSCSAFLLTFCVKH